MHPDSLVAKRAFFASKHLFVTPHDDAQRYPSGDHVVQSTDCLGLKGWVAEVRGVRSNCRWGGGVCIAVAAIRSRLCLSLVAWQLPRNNKSHAVGVDVHALQSVFGTGHWSAGVPYRYVLRRILTCVLLWRRCRTGP
jgi:hypothetical protein